MNLYAYCGNNPVMCCDPTGHSPNGIFSQVFTSVFSYAGMAIASVFNEDIRSDMDAIGWNPFNNNEQTVLNSTAVSFYKGVPVFRTRMDRSGSFCAIFLNDHASIDTVRHEYGHNVQQMILGPLTYGLTIGLPSALKWSSRQYYERPWEINADYFGGVESRSHSSQNMSRGYQYLEVARLFGIFAYLFLPGEYNT